MHRNELLRKKNPNDFCAWCGQKIKDKMYMAGTLPDGKNEYYHGECWNTFLATQQNALS
jgi:hypothetical protein